MLVPDGPLGNGMSFTWTTNAVINGCTPTECAPNCKPYYCDIRALADGVDNGYGGRPWQYDGAQWGQGVNRWWQVELPSAVCCVDSAIIAPYAGHHAEGNSAFVSGSGDGATWTQVAGWDQHPGSDDRSGSDAWIDGQSSATQRLCTRR